MKKLLIAGFGLMAALAASAVGVDGTVCLSFASKGPDCYKDGTPVLKGDCYALVWTAADKTFGGFKADGQLADAADKLVFVAPLALDGGCPLVVVNIAEAIYEKEYKNGTFDLYLVDTRKWLDGVPTVTGVDAAGKLTFVNASEKLTDDEKAPIKVAASGAAPSATEPAPATGTGATGSVLPPDFPQPRISNITDLGDKVMLTITNTDPAANYVVVYGTSLEKVGTFSGEAKIGGGVINLVAPKLGDSTLYTVIRK